MTTAVRNFALPPTGVSASRDTSAQEAAQMELQAVQAERRGEDSECIQLMEQALQIRSKSATQMEEQLRHQTSDVEYARLSEDYTNASHELYDAAERLVVKCNTCGVHLFKKGDFDSAKPLLDYCLQLTSEDAFPLREVDDRRRHLRGVTQNNLGCMERRRGHFKDALAHMQDSMETAGTESPVAYMNMSAILIQLRLSDEAAKMAERAVDLLANTPEDPSLLAVAHHNLAMALEPLDVDRCIEEYALSYQLACSTIGRDSETTKSIERSWLRYWHIHRPGQVAPFMASPRNKTPRAVAAPNNNNKEGGAAATTKPGEEEGPVDDVVEIFPHPFLRLHDAKGGPRGSPTDGGGSGPSFGGPGMDTIKRITGRAASNANNGAGGAGSGAGPRASAASSKWGPSVSRTGSKFGSGGVEAGGAGSRSASGVNNNNGARGGSLAASAAGGPRRPLGKGPTSTTSAGGAGGFRNGRPSYESGEAGGAHGRTSLQAGEAGADSKRRNRSPTSNNRAGGAEAGSPTKAGKDGRQGSAQRQLSQSSKAVQDGASGAQRSSLFARNNNNNANGAGHKSEGGAHGHNDATASSTRRRLSPLDAKASAKDKSTTDGTSTQAADHHGGGKSGSAGGLTKGAGGKRLPPLADGAAAGASSATNGRVDSAGAAASDSSAAQQRLSAGGRRTKSGRNSDASPPLGTVKELTLFERNGGDLVAYLTDRLEMLLHDEEELERMYAKAVVIQRHYRGHLARRRVKDARANLARDRDLLRIRRNIAARKIQRFVRLHMRGSRFGGRRRQGGGIDRFFHGAENLAAVKLQRMARGWLARRIFRRKHRYHRECQRAATRIQNWYRGCLARRSCAAMLAAQAAAEAEAKEAERRDYAATLIQSSWRAHAQEKRTRDELRRRVQQKQEEEARRQFVAARRIQCAWRCAMARDLVSDLRFVTEQREAERKAAEKKRNATIKLQSFGRMIIVRRESMPQLTQARLRAAQIISKGKDTYKAAAMIQRAYRAHFAREELRRLKKLHHHELEAARHAVLATLMQRVGRGFEERRALQQEACELSQEAAQYQRQLAELHRLDVEKAETEKMMLAPETIKAVRMLSIEEDDARAELELEEMRKRRDCANVESRAAVSMEAQQEEATPEEEEDEEEAAFPADASTTAGSEDDDDNDDDDDEGAAPAPRHGTPPPPPTASALPSIPEAVMGLGRIIHAKKELRGRQARRDEYLRTLEAQEPHIHEQPAFTSATVDPFAHSDDDEDDENEAVPAVAQTAAPQAPATSSSPQQHQPDVAARDDADDADDVEAALASEACKGRPSRAQLKAEEQRRNDLLEARHQYRLKQIESASTAEQLKPFARTRLPLYPGATRPKRQPEVVEDLGAAVVGGAQAARAKREEELGHMVLRLYRGYQARCYTRALKELLQTYLDLLGDHGRFDGPQLDFTKLRYYSSIYRPITSWSPAKTPPEYKRFEAPSPASSISDTPEAIEEAEAEAEAEEVDEVVQPQQPQTAPAPSATAAPAVVAEEESEEARSERHASEVALEGFILVIKAKKERSARASLRDAYLDELHHQSSPLEGFAKIIKAKKELSVLKSQRDEYIRSIQQSSEAFAMEMGGTEEGSSRPDTAKQIAEEGQRLQKLEDDEVLFDEDERLSALKSQEAEFCSANKVGDVDEVVLADDGDHHDAPTRSPPQPPAMPSEAVEVPDVESTGTSRPNTGVVRGRPRPLSGADIEEDAAMEVEEQTPERGGSPEPPCRSESVATRAPEPSTDGSRPDTATQISRERTALLRLSGEVQLLNEMAELQNLQSQEVLINSFSPERVEERGDDAVCQELSALRHGDAESTDGSRPDTAAQIAQEHRRLVRLSGTEEILGEKQRLSCLASREEVANNSMPNSPNAEADEVVGSPGSARGSSTSASDLLTGFAKIIKAKKSVAARRSRCQQDVEKRVASESVERQEEEEAVEGHVVVVTPQRAAELLCGFAKVIQAKKCVAERKARRDAYLEHHERPDTTSSADAETADGDGAARMLQSFFRCVLARRDLMQLREAKYQRLATDLAREKMHDVSASCIQRAYRQHAARRGPESRREAAEQLVDDILSQNMGLPGAEEGAEPINAGASTAPPEPKEDRGLGTSYTDLDSARSASSNAIVREVDE